MFNFRTLYMIGMFNGLWRIKSVAYSEDIIKSKGKAIPVQAFHSPVQFQEVEAPIFIENRHMKVEGCHTYAPAAFTHQEIFLVLISVRGWVDII